MAILAMGVWGVILMLVGGVERGTERGLWPPEDAGTMFLGVIRNLHY
jgi:hypothetical protein